MKDEGTCAQVHRYTGARTHTRTYEHSTYPVSNMHTDAHSHTLSRTHTRPPPSLSLSLTHTPDAHTHDSVPLIRTTFVAL